MAESIPASAGDGNGGAEAKFGQALLDQTFQRQPGRAALLLVEGLPSTHLSAVTTRVLRRSDAAALLDDGRLAILAPHLRETSGAADLAARVLASLRAPAADAAAVGIALAPEDGDSLTALFAVAEKALARARTYARGRFAFADAARDARWRIGPLLAGAIAEALADEELRLAFQPIVRLDNGEVTGAEALLRWRRPGGEDWPPSIFIPEAERRGLMEPITAWTFEAACRALVDLNLPSGNGFRLGVNLSATTLGYGAPDIVGEILARFGIDPASIMVEITETMPFIDNPAAVADVHAIGALGCGIAIDDFGAGHASLAYAVQLPATRIKLDALLIRAAATDRRARAAVTATVGLARDIGADVVAEGVADDGLAGFLVDAGVELGQGALFGLPAEGPLKLDRLGPAA